MKADPGLYDHWPYEGRPRIVWPEGRRIAFWVAQIVEFYELSPPANPSRPAWFKPAPDLVGYGARDYGNRAGHWRLLDILDRRGVRATVPLSTAVTEHHPELIAACAARGFEFLGHGVYNTRFAYGMDAEQEGALMQECVRAVEAATGQRIRGWLAPALTHTERTMDLLAANGFRYTCDLFHDDQPAPVKVASGRLASVPFALDWNDGIAYGVHNYSPAQQVEVLKAAFDCLYAEGEQSGTVMCLPLHGFLSGQPYRAEVVEEILDYVMGHEGVWMATAGEIADHWLAHHHDASLSHIAASAEGAAR